MAAKEEEEPAGPSASSAPAPSSYPPAPTPTVKQFAPAPASSTGPPPVSPRAHPPEPTDAAPSSSSFVRPALVKRVSWADRVEGGALIASDAPSPASPVAAPASAAKKGGLKKGFFGGPAVKTSVAGSSKTAAEPAVVERPRKVVEIGSVVERDASAAASSSTSSSSATALPQPLSVAEFRAKNLMAHGPPSIREFEGMDIEEFAAANGGYIPAEVVRSLERQDQEKAGTLKLGGPGNARPATGGAGPSTAPQPSEAQAPPGKKLSKFKQRVMGLAE